MESPNPRLMITLPKRPEISTALDLELPGIPYAFSEPEGTVDWSATESMLVGSLARDPPRVDPAHLPSLRFVQRIYTGLDGFPFDRFPASVRVAGNVGGFAPYVAEHAFALALTAARDIPGAQALARSGRLRPAPEPRCLYGARAVVLGYGEIGREIGRRLHAFGAEVAGVNRSGTPVEGCDRMYPADRLTEALGEGDLAFEARPLTARTRGSIATTQLAAMPEEGILVNVGRAGTIDEQALYQHLTEHPGFRAATDVWWAEDFVQGSIVHHFPFFELPNFYGTPHSAGGGGGNPSVQARALKMAIANLRRFFVDGRPLYVADRTEYVP
jgi:phosphoglycerate dehydrogenase-like enzyme